MISTQFLQNCLAGDEESIETLVRSHQRGVFQLALSILDDAPSQDSQQVNEAVAAAEAVTRETFIKAIDRLPRYREDTPFLTWLYRITVEVAIRYARRSKGRRWLAHSAVPLSRIFPRLVGDSASAATILPEPHFLPGDKEMWLAVRKLSLNLRLPVVLRYYHDFPVSEIARVLRMSEGGVHARLDQARERITRSLEPG